MKQILFSLIQSTVLVFSVSVSSCTTDNDNDIKLPSVPYTISSTEKEGVVMTYSLLNSKGDTTFFFSKGEEIVFDLRIKNTTDKHIPIPGSSKTLGYNTFRIYSDDGKDFGVSWSYMEDWTEEIPYLWPQIDYHYQCPWYSDATIKASYPFVFNPSKKKLTKGHYFTEAFCYLSSGTTLYCIIHFNIQ